jgi:hypothetical protein
VERGRGDDYDRTLGVGWDTYLKLVNMLHVIGQHLNFLMVSQSANGAFPALPKPIFKVNNVSVEI